MIFSQINVLFLLFSDSSSGHMFSLIIPMILFYWLPNSTLACEKLDACLHNCWPFLEIFLVIFLNFYLIFSLVLYLWFYFFLQRRKITIFVSCEDLLNVLNLPSPASISFKFLSYFPFHCICCFMVVSVDISSISQILSLALSNVSLKTSPIAYFFIWKSCVSFIFLLLYGYAFPFKI